VITWNLRGSGECPVIAAANPQVMVQWCVWLAHRVRSFETPAVNPGCQKRPLSNHRPFVTRDRSPHAECADGIGRPAWQQRSDLEARQEAAILLRLREESAAERPNPETMSVYSLPRYSMPPTPPVPLSATVSSQMSRMPRRDSGPEMRIRRILHQRGLRYRVHPALPGRPDIAFTRVRVAV
jgi:G:T-mismatch repair DNA endonuclease (very short patch repair protein)